MHFLTKEQKLSNLQELLDQKKKKFNNLKKEIENLEKKLERTKSSSENSQENQDPFEMEEPSFLRNLERLEKLK